MAIPYWDQIKAAATKYGLEPELLAGLIKQESGFNPNAGSPAGARGLTQLMPGTAAGLGVTNSLDPEQAIDGGAHYLRQQLDAFGGDERKALAAYNAGPGAVTKYGGIPPYAETQNYVRIVLGNRDAYRKSKEGGVAGATAGADAFATGDGAADSGGGFNLVQSVVKGMVWIVLILGGAALVVAGIARIGAAAPSRGATA